MIKPIKSTKYHFRTKLLLHVCCACCATEVYNRLKDDYEVTLFWYNPNIYPHSEYHNRLKSLKKLVKDLNCKYLIDNDYDSDLVEWEKAISGLENEPEGGKRCEKCYQFRLEQTAKVAKENGFDIFTTTLTISPHKNAALINQIGKQIASKYKIDYLESDFKKQDGFKKSIELSHKHNLYRQNYCGCIYSIRN